MSLSGSFTSVPSKSSESSEPCVSHCRECSYLRTYTGPSLLPFYYCAWLLSTNNIYEIFNRYNNYAELVSEAFKITRFWEEWYGGGVLGDDTNYYDYLSPLLSRLNQLDERFISQVLNEAERNFRSLLLEINQVLQPDNYNLILSDDRKRKKLNEELLFKFKLIIDLLHKKIFDGLDDIFLGPSVPDCNHFKQNKEQVE